MTSASATLRQVSIATLSARRELLLVARVAAAIVAGVWLFLASHFTASGGATPIERNFLPFQKTIADRPAAEQRTFRELQEGLLEAERLRSAAAWPAVPQLAADGIPPFAADPTQRVKVSWELIQRGSIVNYLGIPESDGPAWLLLVQEPLANAPPDQAFEDEEHHRLASGEMLRVSTWVHADGRKMAKRLVPVPQVEGWTQLLGSTAYPTATPRQP